MNSTCNHTKPPKITWLRVYLLLFVLLAILIAYTAGQEIGIQSGPRMMRVEAEYYNKELVTEICERTRYYPLDKDNKISCDFLQDYTGTIFECIETVECRLVNKAK